MREKKIKMRVFIWTCQKCNVHNESPINVCSYCQFIHVGTCLVSYAGTSPVIGRITCMKCGGEPPGNHDLRKIGGRPMPLQTLYKGTLDRIASELGDKIDGILDVVEELKPYVGMQLCYSCHPADGGALARSVKQESFSEAIDRMAMAKDVKEALEAKIQRDPSIEPGAYPAIARSIIRRMDEDMGYDAEDRRVQRMIREARPVKFSLMKKNLSGDDLLSAREDIQRRMHQLTWRYKAARNQMDKTRVMIESMEKEQSKAFGRIKFLENLIVQGSPEERINAKVKLGNAKRRHGKLDKEIDEGWERMAVNRKRAWGSMSMIRKYRSLFRELGNIYHIRWETLLSSEKGSDKFGYEIRYDAFGVDEIDTPELGYEECYNCKKRFKKVNTVILKDGDDKATFHTEFLCDLCYKIERKGGPNPRTKKFSGGSSNGVVVQESITQNLDKEMSEHLKMTASMGIEAGMNAVSGKCRRSFAVEVVDYKEGKVELWIIAISPNGDLPKQLTPEYKALVRILPIKDSCFKSAYLWCSLGDSGREEWSKWAKKIGCEFSPLGLKRGASWTSDPWEIAGALDFPLPAKAFDGENLKRFWRTVYEMGDYMTMPWEARVMVIKEGEPHYEDVCLHNFKVEWMEKEVRSFYEQEDTYDKMWVSYGFGLKVERLPGRPEDMFAMAGKMADGSRPQPKDEEYFKELERKQALRLKQSVLQSEFDKLYSDIISFQSYLKFEGKGMEWEVVAAEWREIRKEEKDKQKANKGNAQPK